MGLFGGNFSKPGRGISKEEAAKRNYFDILGCHFWDLIKLNLLYVLVNIIFIAAFVWFMIPILVKPEDFINYLFGAEHVILPIGPFLPFMFMGPFTAGFSYVLRNWSRQEHAFLVSDFFEYSKKNWKQGLALSVIGTVVTYLFLTAFFFYLRCGLPRVLVLTLGAIIAIILIASSFYTYPMIVTFDMKLKDVYRNSLIFALAKLPQNLFFLVIVGAVHILLLWNLPFIWIILMLLFLIAWSGFTVAYYVWHVMNKHMISQLPA
ncbi:MAG: DUF624 domain-containing protein, partial [Ruminococcaceae bacterium]|nr:DUF624 domain-containing protein [Oscillospiraceae bacterium]